MGTNLDRFKADLLKLISVGSEMQLDISYRSASKADQINSKVREKAEQLKGIFDREYQAWYTQALALIKQLMPDRLLEFTQLYQGDGKRKQIAMTTYNIQDWFNGIISREKYDYARHFHDIGVVANRFNVQLEILKSVQTRFDSSLFDIAQLVRADLFDSELDAAQELAKSGFLRGAGAIAGVVLEKHLAQVSSNHNVSTHKQHPTIGDFNELLKGSSVLDVPTWRQIQRLADIRNLCDHNKHREPTKDEVTELIDGVGKISKTLF